MAQITLQPAQVVALSEFLKKHGRDTFFLAKDQGAYVGATNGKEGDEFENLIFYFRGMDPSKNDDWYDNAWMAFGGDDFGEHLDAEFIHKMAAKRSPKVVIKVTATSINMSGTALKDLPPQGEAPSKLAEPKAPKAKKQTKGERIMDYLKMGMTDEKIVKEVGTTLNSVRWYKSKMHKEAA